MNTFAENLLALREAEGLTKTELAKRICVSEGAIRAWENGKTQPNAENIIALAKLFDISTDELLGMELESLPFVANARSRSFDQATSSPSKAEAHSKKASSPLETELHEIMSGLSLSLQKQILSYAKWLSTQ